MALPHPARLSRAPFFSSQRMFRARCEVFRVINCEDPTVQKRMLLPLLPFVVRYKQTTTLFFCFCTFFLPCSFFVFFCLFVCLFFFFIFFHFFTFSLFLAFSFFLFFFFEGAVTKVKRTFSLFRFLFFVFFSLFCFFSLFFFSLFRIHLDLEVQKPARKR